MVACTCLLEGSFRNNLMSECIFQSKNEPAYSREKHIKFYLRVAWFSLGLCEQNL